ncbi:MAG: hypothetical protein IPM60_02000 [Rhodospirillales bacterium]|nr:hypothetical protein [Rhodospirillales bacterium]
MALIRIEKNSFASGEVSPRLYGRSDLNAYANGAAHLRNVFVHPTGGLSRRSGLRHVSAASGLGRLVAFEFSTEQAYLLLFAQNRVDVYAQGRKITELPTPWILEQVAQMNWTQSADTLLVVHPNCPPKKITRLGEGDWKVSDWQFVVQDTGRREQPHHKFFHEDVTLQPGGTSGNVSVTASSFVFHPDHTGCRFRIRNKEVEVIAVETAGGSQNDGWWDRALVNVKETLQNVSASKDWSEQAFSAVRGYPASVTFHQDRLVIGGSRSLPNRLWLSKSSDLFNFDLGEGLDDESINFGILSDQVNAIRAVFSGRHLQVFTSGAEWMVTGDPLTPTNIQLHRQTRIGSPSGKSIPPQDVDGATIFVPRSSNQIREFLFTDVEQAYQSADLALLSQHLIKTPADMDYDSRKRLLHVVMADGTLGTLTIYRTEQITAWTPQETDGFFRSVSVSGDDVYLLVERQGSYNIEVLDSAIHVDAAMVGEVETPKLEWSGLDHLEGRTVKVVADGAVRPDTRVEGGMIVLDEPASTVVAGLGFSHFIEPLPPRSSSGGSAQGANMRPITITFRFDNTYALQLDTGRGLMSVPFKRFTGSAEDFSPTGFSGEKTVRAFGWRHGADVPIWRIEQDIPLPFTLLSVATVVSVNG